jgi:hypothetical protein
MPQDEKSSLTLLLLQGVLPEPIVDFLNEHVFNPDAPLQIFKQNVLSAANQAFLLVYPLAAPLIDRVLVFLDESPEMVSLAVIAVLTVVMIVILNWVRRIMLFWTRLAFRMVFLAMMVAFASALYQRGFMNSTRDAVVLVSKVAGYMAAMKDVWISEYQRYDAQAKGYGDFGRRSAYGRGGTR